MHILMIEDDLDLGRALMQALRTEGIEIHWVRRIHDAARALADSAFDCVALDLTLPDGDGLNLLGHWRRTGTKLPVIIMTARSTLDERLSGLDGGADDFIVKPFAPSELASRLRAVVRRSARQASELWTVGDIEIDPRRQTVQLSGTALELSPREFRLLLELARVADTVLSKGELSRRLEPFGEPVDFAAIEVHVSNLRRKIGVARIRTVRGVGYSLAL